MPKRLSRAEPDANQRAFLIVQGIIAKTEGPQNVVPMRRRKNPAAVALGRRGGQASAVARMTKISPEKRRQIASNAARAMWKKKREEG